MNSARFGGEKRKRNWRRKSTKVSVNELFRCKRQQLVRTVCNPNVDYRWHRHVFDYEYQMLKSFYCHYEMLDQSHERRPSSQVLIHLNHINKIVRVCRRWRTECHPHWMNRMWDCLRLNVTWYLVASLRPHSKSKCSDNLRGRRPADASSRGSIVKTIFHTYGPQVFGAFSLDSSADQHPIWWPLYLLSRSPIWGHPVKISQTILRHSDRLKFEQWLLGTVWRWIEHKREWINFCSFSNYEFIF